MSEPNEPIAVTLETGAWACAYYLAVSIVITLGIMIGMYLGLRIVFLFEGPPTTFKKVIEPFGAPKPARR